MVSQGPGRDHDRRAVAASGPEWADGARWMAWVVGWKASSIGCWTTATTGRSPGRRRSGSGRSPGAASVGRPRLASPGRRSPRPPHRLDVPGRPWRRSPAAAPPPRSGPAASLPLPPPVRRPPGPNPMGPRRGPRATRRPAPARTGRRKTASRSPAGGGRSPRRPSPSIPWPPPRPRLPRRADPCPAPPADAERARDTFKGVGLRLPSP